MSSADAAMQNRNEPLGARLSHRATTNPPLRERVRNRMRRRNPVTNVSAGERMVSVSAGLILGLLGLGRRDRIGMVIAGVGGALVFRGTTGHCAVYESLGIDTAK